MLTGRVPSDTGWSGKACVELALLLEPEVYLVEKRSRQRECKQDSRRSWDRRESSENQFSLSQHPHSLSPQWHKTLPKNVPSPLATPTHQFSFQIPVALGNPNDPGKAGICSLGSQSPWLMHCYCTFNGVLYVTSLPKARRSLWQR